MSDTGDTPTLAKVIKDAIDARLFDLHTCMPATIESYDPQTGLASVSPCLKRKYVSGDLVDLPVISNVPVIMPRSAAGTAYVSLPLKSGDPVTLVFAERSLDNWKTLGGKVDPQDPRKHALTDAYALVGGYPKLGFAPMALANDSDLMVVNGASSITVTGSGDVVTKTAVATVTVAASGKMTVAAGPAGASIEIGIDGKVKITNAGGELIAALVQLFTDIQNGLTTTMLGPEPLVMPTFATDLLLLQTFKG